MPLDSGPNGECSLQPVELDNPGEMGGRMASPTFVGWVEELQSLKAARGWAATTEPTVVLVGGRAGEDDVAGSLR